MTCRDCLIHDICKEKEKLMLTVDNLYELIYQEAVEVSCRHFKNKADVVEVETIKAWLYGMAINNVGCVIDGDFSNACEEIISRIDGLSNFAKERSEGDG